MCLFSIQTSVQLCNKSKAHNDYVRLLSNTYLLCYYTSVQYVSNKYGSVQVSYMYQTPLLLWWSLILWIIG